MACPYFMPVAKLENGNWPHPGRLPLGCGWNGHCTAPGHEGQAPSQDIVQAFCNLGYASSCGWAPVQRSWDALRFAVSAPDREKGGARISDADSRSSTVHIVYVCEFDHRPVEQGRLSFELATATWLQRHKDARIQKMAECFLESYLKKKS